MVQTSNSIELVITSQLHDNKKDLGSTHRKSKIAIRCSRQQLAKVLSLPIQTLPYLAQW